MAAFDRINYDQKFCRAVGIFNIGNNILFSFI